MPRILVIDDEPELREFVVMSLELNDYEVEEAEARNIQIDKEDIFYLEVHLHHFRN